MVKTSPDSILKLNAERSKTHFRALRHRKTTMEDHKTKNILHVMKPLGHKSIANTLLYTQLVEFENDEYDSVVAKTVEEAQSLVESGFDFACKYNGLTLFRKRK